MAKRHPDLPPDCREKLLIRLGSRERAPIVPEFVLWPLGRV